MRGNDGLAVARSVETGVRPPSVGPGSVCDKRAGPGSPAVVSSAARASER